MCLHRKELMQPVKVGKPDARFGLFLLEQFGGATGELTAALQYWVQSFHVEHAGIRDMLQDIAIEEFSHLEVGKLIAQHTSKIDQTAVYNAPLFKLKGGGPHFLDSQGSWWTAAYIQEGGNVVRVLCAHISAEAGARQTYEVLIHACEDEGTKQTLTHFLTREITHANMFMKALNSIGKIEDPFFGNIPPDDTVKLVFNLSQGQGCPRAMERGTELRVCRRCGAAGRDAVGAGQSGRRTGGDAGARPIALISKKANQAFICKK